MESLLTFFLLTGFGGMGGFGGFPGAGGAGDQPKADPKPKQEFDDGLD